MKNILFYTHFLTVGGIEKVTIEYLKLLSEAGYSVDLLVDYDMGTQNYLLGQVPSEVKVSFVKNKKISSFIYLLRDLSKKSFLFSPFLFASVILCDFFLYHLKVKNIINLKNYHATITFYQFLPSYITNYGNCRHFIWLHGSVEHFFGGYKNLFRFRYLKKLERYDRIITIADEMREQLHAFYPSMNLGRVERIYNPFDFAGIKSLSNDLSSLSSIELDLINKSYVCHVSRVDEYHKDIATLLRAYAVFLKSFDSNHNLIIVGSGPDLKKLTDLSSELGIAEKVFFVGNQLNPYVWMKSADILVLSSKSEGFGLVLVEAMAVNTFVIASECKTGPKEILGNGLYGDLFKTGDYFLLAELIEHALLDETYRHSKTLEAGKRIHEFDRGNAINQLVSIIES